MFVWPMPTRRTRRKSVKARRSPKETISRIAALAVVNETGKEGVVAILGPGDFLGEGCLAGQSICTAIATAISPTSVLVIAKNETTVCSTRNTSSRIASLSICSRETFESRQP